MKVIKKYFKVVLCFVAFAICSFLMAFAPTMAAYASLQFAQDEYNVAINSIQMPKVVDVSSTNVEETKFNVPLLTAGSFGEVSGETLPYSSYTVRVIDPAGYNHDYVVEGGNTTPTYPADTDYFKKDGNFVNVGVLTNGEYRVVYIVKTTKEVSGKTVTKSYYSNTYKVTVKNVSYELDFSVQSGDKKGWVELLPDEVAVDTNSKIELPTAVAKKLAGTDNGVELDVEKGEIIVSRNGREQSLKDLANPAHESIESDFIKDTDGKLKLIPSTSGVYKIQYTYKSGVNRPTKTFTITVTEPESFTAPAEIKVSTTPTFPQIGVGEKGITLPKLTVKNENVNNIAHNVRITIEHEDDNTIKQDLGYNNYTFNMTLGAEGFGKQGLTYEDLLGNYIIKYEISDAYNSTVYEKRIEGVKVQKNPEIFMAYDYDATGTVFGKDFVVTEQKVNTDAATQLQSKYGYDEIMLPAAYATDLVGSSEDFIIIRYLRSVESDTIYYVDNLKYNEKTKELEKVEYNGANTPTGYNYSGDQNIGQVNKAVKFYFTEDNVDAAKYDGEYELEYRVISKAVKERESYLYVSSKTPYTFTVLPQTMASYVETTPVVEITNIEKNATVDAGKDLVIKLTEKDDDDARLKSAVFYYYGEKRSDDQLKADFNSVIDNATLNNKSHALDQILADMQSFTDSSATPYATMAQALLNETKDGYVAKFDRSKGEQAVIVAVTYNDYGEISVDTKVVKFKVTNEDPNVAPSYEILDLADTSFKNGSDVHTYESLNNVKIGDTIILPTVQFTDWINPKNTGLGVNDENLELSVVYYVNTPETDAGIQYKSPSGKLYANNAITGGEIKASRAGTYFVVYTATDDAGNTQVVYFTFEVQDTTKPLLSVNATGENVTISGNTVTAEVGSTINFDAIVRDGTSNLNITDEDEVTVTVKVDDNGDGLNYDQSGDRAMSYIFNSVGNYTLTFTATYGAREAVTKVVYVQVKNVELKWLEEFDIQEYANTNAYVYLPDIAASHGAVVNVTVKAPNDSKLTEEVTKTEDNKVSVWKFKTNDVKGKYTVTYTAKVADAEIKKEFTIRVGDNVPPTFSMNYESELRKSIVYSGSDIEYTLNVNIKDKKFVVTINNNGETRTYDTGLVIRDKDDVSATARELYWSDLDVDLLKDDTALTPNSGKYTIDEAGNYAIRLKVVDSYGNQAEKLIKFKVVNETEAESETDAVVGIVLIVISLVVLAGVILYFLFTGKKGGNSKVKSNKSKKVEDKPSEETVVEETPVVEEVKEENTEAKEGEIEE